METFLKIVGGLVLAAVVVVAMGLLVSYPLSLLWNGCLVPAVEGLREVSWLQTWGILVACGLLFKSTLLTSK